MIAAQENLAVSLSDIKEKDRHLICCGESTCKDHRDEEDCENKLFHLKLFPFVAGFSTAEKPFVAIQLPSTITLEFFQNTSFGQHMPAFAA